NSGGTFTHHRGTLTIDGGTFDPGTADYTIDGAGNPTVNLASSSATLSGGLCVADTRKGTLEIVGGASVENTGNAAIGRVFGSQGTVTVKGAGSKWDNDGFLRVGHFGIGTLEISGGGSVASSGTAIGADPGSDGKVTVDGTGSTWDDSAELSVGYLGTGTLAITNGGSVTNPYGYIGRKTGSTGTVTVEGGGSTWTNTYSLFVGGSSSEAGGTGELYIQDNGSVVVGQTLDVKGSGAVHLEGGVLWAEAIDHTGGGQFNFSGGTLAARTFEGSLWVGGGCAIAPGNGVGTLEVTNTMTMTGGTYAWELGPSGADMVTVADTLEFGGDWSLQLLDAGAPVGLVGDLPIFSYGSLTGGLGNYTIDTSNVGDWIFTEGGPTLVNDTDNHQILLTGLEEVGEKQWNNANGGSYHDSANWMGGIVPNSVGAVANFLEKIEADSSVHCQEPVVVGTMNFESPNSYTIAGPGEITLEASTDDAQINVLSGNHRIEAPLSLGSNLTVDAQATTGLVLSSVVPSLLVGDLTKNGLGTLSIDVNNPLLGDVTVNQGVLEVGENVLALGSGSNTIYLGEGSTLKAVGVVSHRVVNTGAPGTSTLEAVGAMDVGVTTLANGYDYQGALEVGPHSVGLKDVDEAELYGAHMAGGTISSFNGIHLLPLNMADALNSRLYGFGKVNGNVVMGTQGVPTAAVVVADPGQTIELTGVVQTGSSTFVNDVIITGTERLGFSPAVGMKLGGAPIGPDVVLDIYGDVGADFESEIPDSILPPPSDPVSGYGQFYVAGSEPSR
ncbi:MAG: hypothetical protein ACYSWU_24305, partial [Planctomycetota bacterium]